MSVYRLTGGKCARWVDARTGSALGSRTGALCPAATQRRCRPDRHRPPPPRARDRARRAGPRPRQPQSAGRRRDRPRRRASSARASTARSAARTPRSRRSAPPASTIWPRRRSTCRSSPAATTAGRRRARTRSATAGIGRVVVASDDPSEHASGRGLGILRDEGVEVVLADGELAARARLLNQPFRKHARTGRPWVLFKSAMTLDGKVATRSGDSKWISRRGQPPARPPLARRVRCRRRRDRHRAGRRSAAHRAESTASHRQPRRIVFDSLARLPLTPSSFATRARSRSPWSSPARPRGPPPTR